MTLGTGVLQLQQPNNGSVNGDPTGSVTVASIYSRGSANTSSAGMDFILSGTGQYKFYRPGQASAPAVTIDSVTGNIAAGNLLSGTIANGTSQAGTTPTKVLDNNYWSKINRLTHNYIRYKTSAVTGGSSGPLVFSLPFACEITYNFDNAMVIRSGTVTNCRLQFTAGSSTVNLLVSNGVGGFNMSTPQATDDWTIIFQYGAST